MQLPISIHLLTLHDNSLLGNDGTLILRLDHSFETGEDPVYSQPVSIDLDSLFTHIQLDTCTEMSLSANAPVCGSSLMCWVLSLYRSCLR